MKFKYFLINFHYSKNSSFKLENQKFELNYGDKLKISGENGSGKTTLLKIITGIIKCENFSFKAIDNDKNITVKNINEIHSFVADTPQLMENLSVKDNMRFFLSLWKEDKKTYQMKFESFLEMFKLNQYLNESIKDLSLGTKQKVFISLMLSRDVFVYILDEPFNALDKESQIALSNYINNSSKSFIVVSHDNNTINYNQEIHLRRSNNE